VLLTVDANIYHQQNVAPYDIAVMVLRAYDNNYHSILPMLSELLNHRTPGEIYHLYADERLRESDQQRGKSSYTPRAHT
jgi:hypothetical protein